ncbi:hypothetical protein FXF51_00825 [Nonomuraea sp. PA05]|uniref:hypothetical protein n=1 Tax=Nonomuraea sp. PA05 TaxID=2604466 RepID=UPI0011D48846|nr:hypothetical protein [Nonomuraea sp. PA05]TYB71016.1 hypothetical protein FXF51_00825 [Nonomuraea sp. PA05]
MNGPVIAATASRKAYADKIVLDGLGLRHPMRSAPAQFNALLGGLIAIGLVIGLVPAGRKGPEVRQLTRNQSLTPLIETLRGLLTGPPSAGPVIMAIAGCAVLSVIGYLWVRGLFTKRG